MARKVYGGWDNFGSPEYDNSSISGGRPIATHGNNKKANKNQSQFNKIRNCKKCDIDALSFCGRHASLGSKLL